MNDDVRSEVLGAIPYGFYVVGTLGPDGKANGFTVNWALQVSFEPPQIAVAIEREGNAHGAIENSEVFSLNFLDRSQEDLARRLAQHVEPEGDTLAGARFVPGPQTGAPIFEDCFAHLECRVVGSTETGDHTLFIGEVVGADLKRQAEILTDLETPLSYGG
jgi:flavin reductase (DIM6/NTAB) family NADH-FMN oxidoreductase RutF